MMRNTASIQVNVDIGAPTRSTRAGSRAHDLGPVLTACFANSPFDAVGRPSGFRSTRAAVWQAIDPARTDSARRPTATRRAPLERATCSTRPVMMIRVDDAPHVALDARMSFEQWIVDGHALGWPDDRRPRVPPHHAVPAGAPRGWLELRMIDALPSSGGRSRSRSPWRCSTTRSRRSRGTRGRRRARPLERRRA